MFASREQYIVDEFIKSNGRGGETSDLKVTVPEGATPRETMAATNRARFKEMFGYDHDHASDSELLDAFTYNVFPNFGPWGGFMPNIVYRWRPWPDQDHCLMEVRILTRVPEGQPRPRSAPMRFLTDAEPWGGGRSARPRARGRVRPGHGEPAVRAAGHEGDEVARSPARQRPGDPHPALPSHAGQVPRAVVWSRLDGGVRHD